MDTESSSASWSVHKFGGTSLATPDRIRHVASLLSEHGQRAVQQSSAGSNSSVGPPPTAVVVSAMGGVTDQLLNLMESAPAGDDRLHNQLQALRSEQRDVITELLPSEAASSLLAALDEDVDDISDVLRATRHMRSAPDTARDLVAGYGELWSARVLAGVLQANGVSAVSCDARDVLVVEHGRLGPEVDWDTTRERFVDWQAEQDAEVLVLTGFIASTPEGVPTTLGRNGSDYSAAIFAALLGAKSLTIWTDTDGVMSADPRYVPDAQTLDTLTYEEAMELAYFGARVIHPRTMAPAIEHEIPITIRNTFEPDTPGTRIHLEGSGDSVVKGFSTIDDVALLNLEGTGMIGVPGIARRLFDALEDENVPVILISQGSSEHSICFAVPQEQVETAREATQQAFYAEMDRGEIKQVEVTPNCSILAVIGDRMSGTPGVAATFFGALGDAGVNVRAIAQGSSERNISAVVDGADAQRALRAVHAGFYLSKRTLSIGIIGAGNVGAALLDQIGDQVERLREEQDIDLRVRGVTTTDTMLRAEQSVDLDAWRDALAAGEEADLEAFVDHVQTDYHPHTVLVDCTASDYVAQHYERWLRQGIHVVTPNKRANTASWETYQSLQAASRGTRPHYLYETTVGAGLPIIQTLENLTETGDRVHHIEGILSGTLSYLFNAFDGNRPFSEILTQAKAAGFTEPDPRDDLSGMDVARKVVILAREMGLSLELDDVTVEGLVPDALKEGSVEEFLERLPEHDETMTDILRTAQAEGKVLRFVGSVKRDGTASVRLRRYPEDHAFARISHTDNIVRFQTDRYQQNPLIVQGPGAGPEVTAAGVFADLLRLMT
ncbi:bifunctional aspartate kinase/homoserine dehydrogenase I [Salinibacter sp. 10B]|uniref:bifunctional aspartate kinase/homoserine dehydrogenase I n=1 Tax=Salinibacter sp. 10B TaxID=1923971 RepID=UPI000CF3A759|nr:bifunctional aspartate kinase/homoserine dehydrogenase I [Salinibacter sp. 10B]PQJ35400.1 bifunctional aspartate kinase/homoserine dehydrogenase I [Salinibacter sp. 10B]